MTEIAWSIISGIKCDNEQCDFTDDTAKFENYKDWLNRPCPKCGSNLLTEADLEATKNLVKLSESLNGLADALGIEPPKDSPKLSARMRMDGTGKIYPEDWKIE